MHQNIFLGGTKEDTNIHIQLIGALIYSIRARKITLNENLIFLSIRVK